MMMPGPCRHIHMWRRLWLGLGLGLVVVALTGQNTLTAASGSAEGAEFGRLQRRLFDFRESDPYVSVLLRGCVCAECPCLHCLTTGSDVT